MTALAVTLDVLQIQHAVVKCRLAANHRAVAKLLAVVVVLLPVSQAVVAKLRLVVAAQILPADAKSLLAIHVVQAAVAKSLLAILVVATAVARRLGVSHCKSFSLS